LVSKDRRHLFVTLCFTLLGILAAIWIYLDVGEFFVSYGIYIAAAVYGGVNSIFLITRYI
jgi:hypothetical protein